MKKLTLLSVALLATSVAWADMQELDESDLQQATGQEGISISMKLDFAEGSRISTQNPNTDGNNWQVIDNITGSIEAKQLRTELLDNYKGPNNNGLGVNAVQTVFPDEINFDSLHSDGIYLGAGEQVQRNSNGGVTSGHTFYMGLEIDGSLKMPSQTKLTTFVTQ